MPTQWTKVHFTHFAERTPISRFYQTHLGERHYSSDKLTVGPLIRLCEELGLSSTSFGSPSLARGMGTRLQRFSMLVDDGEIEQLNIEVPGKFEVSGAETMLKQI